MKNQGQKGGYKFFIDHVMVIVYILIHNQSPLRIFHHCRNALQLGQQIKYGEWYFFEDYTIIRIYGFESQPYRLPIFLIHKNFALELRRKRLSFDYLHFASS